VRSKLPVEAFSFYCSLGAGRSFESVARHYDASRATVSRAAKREKWKEQIVEIEAKARETAKSKLLVTLEEMNERHLRISRALMTRGLEALRAMPISTARDAMKALDIAMRHEREIVGGSDTADSVIEID
jgi:hypothetical protein